MKQISLFSEENRFERLRELGDCLERLTIIERESFRSHPCARSDSREKSNAGIPPYDRILLFDRMPEKRGSCPIRIRLSVLHL